MTFDLQENLVISNVFEITTDMKGTSDNLKKGSSKLMPTSAAVAGGASISTISLASNPHVNVDNTIKIALIGCGGRGSGAANEALNTGKDVRLVAMADAFQEKLDSSYKNLLKIHGEKVTVKEDHKFVGLDGYKEAIGLADVVFLATPPGFRPIHFEEAIKQNKHVFMEKPVATDVPGVRKIIENAKLAKEKNLKVVVGHHLRFQKSCIDIVQQLQDGIIGDIVNMQAYFNSAGVWVRDRKAGMTEMEYQVWNWYYFNWLCGDHIVEQHVHDLDFMNWLKGAHPIKAEGMGGRQVRTENRYGQIFDHHYVEYQYADGSMLNSQCRHQKGCWNNWSDEGHGTKGTFNCNPGRQLSYIYDSKGNVIWEYQGEDDTEPHQVEQTEFFRMLRQDEYINQAESGATSTMTAIIGRMATYSGQAILWDDAMNSNKNLMPEEFSWTAEPPVKPDGSGAYPIPVPGSYDTM